MLRETLKSLSTDIFIQRKLITQPALKARFPQFYFPLQTAFFFKVDTAWEPKRAVWAYSYVFGTRSVICGQP